MLLMTVNINILYILLLNESFVGERTVECVSACACMHTRS